MAVRESKPGTDYANDGVNGYIPFVWPDNPDLFNHVQLAANWDAIDGHLGRHEKGLPRLGDLKLWYRVIAGTSPPTGWSVCDGSLVAAVDHDFNKTGSNQRDGNGVGVGADNQLRLPDFRGKTFMGADIAHANGTTAAVGDANAPGPGGHQGSNEDITVPDHSHDHSHLHRTGGRAGTEVNIGVDAEHSDYGPPFFANPYVDTDASGSGVRLSRHQHEHQLKALYSSDARDPDPGSIDGRVKDAAAPDGSTLSRTMTSLQKKVTQPRANGQTGSGNTGSATTTPAGGTAGDALSMDARPASIGVVVLMYVKVAT